MTITTNSNIIQPINNNGLVKAMLEVGSDNTFGISRCYNGIANSSSGNCGFVLTQPGPNAGVVRINFGFPIASRFVAITVKYATGVQGASNGGANYRVFDATSIEVFTFDSGNSADTTAHSFTIIMY